MKTHNPENERTKRVYFDYLREARRYNDVSVDAAAKALHRFETYTGFRSFKAFHVEQAKGFKRHLCEQVSARTNAHLSKATLHATLTALRSFFVWLAGRPGFRSHISYGDGDYFNLSEKDVRIAKARHEQAAPTLAQVQHVIRTLPAETEIQQRDRALIACALLTGARDAALASLNLKHIDIEEGVIFQDARDVKTKFSKTFSTWFFPVGDDIRLTLEEWIASLRSKQWSPDDPLFPATEVVVGPRKQFAPAGLSRRQWGSAAPIRRIFRQSFEVAGLPYFKPHSLRTTLTQLGQRLCRTPEEFKAWSQNLGHERIMTTFTNYGKVEESRQAELIKRLGRAPSKATEIEEAALRLAEMVRGERSA